MSPKEDAIVNLCVQIVENERWNIFKMETDFEEENWSRNVRFHLNAAKTYGIVLGGSFHVQLWISLT